MFETAACRTKDTNLWFPEAGRNANEAKAICLACAYIRECRVVGMAEPHGVWGSEGTKTRERKYRKIVARLTGNDPRGWGDNSVPRWADWKPIADRILSMVDDGWDLDAAMREQGFTQWEVEAMFADLEEEEAAA